MNSNSYDYYWEHYCGLFGKNSEQKLIISPCQKSVLLTYLRSVGDKFGQYVTNIRFCDTIEWNDDRTNIQRKLEWIDDSDSDQIYSSYHSQCDFCQSGMKDIKENKIIGILIHPKGKYPQTYKQRTQKWNQFQVK
jgi:hypothetical protein